jgi:hypothetical protein
VSGGSTRRYPDDISDECGRSRTVSGMRRPRTIDVIGSSILVLSLLTWWRYNTTGETRTLLVFFALSGIGIVLDPIARHWTHLCTEGARKRHPTRERGGQPRA